MDYEKYLVKEPPWEIGAGVKNRLSPAMTLMSTAQVPESSQCIELGWIFGKPDPAPHIFEMVHEKYDEIGFHWGSDPCNPHDLGASILGCHGGQGIVADKDLRDLGPQGTEARSHRAGEA